MSKEDFSASLLSWYGENKRQLPWREEPEPYHVWLSEIMLQQTRVETVREYYRRFLERLPDIRTLSEAPEELYLKLWEGLGYYSRVRNLHRAAVQIMEEYGGKMPESAAELRRLPGIGEYTSAAIASIAFAERIPAIDGNLLRIFARLTAYEEGIRERKAGKAAFSFFLEKMEEGGAACIPGDFNQALMDLGALVCLPNAAPRCELCPLALYCAARQLGREEELPRREERKQREIEKKTILLIRYKGKLALRKRPARGLLAGLYEFPNAEGALTEEEALAYARGLGFSPLRIRALCEAKHIFTHREWYMTGYEIAADELGPGDPEKNGIFLSDWEEIRGRYSIPGAFSAYMEYI